MSGQTPAGGQGGPTEGLAYRGCQESATSRGSKENTDKPAGALDPHPLPHLRQLAPAGRDTQQVQNSCERGRIRRGQRAVREQHKHI